MSVTPLVLYQIYLDNQLPLNVHEASSTILSNMLQSRFIGRVSAMLLPRLFKLNGLTVRNLHYWS